MDVGLLGGFRAQRVDDDERGALLLSRQPTPPATGHRLEPIPRAHSRIGADKQEVVTVVDVGHRGHQHGPVHRGCDDVHGVLVDRADEVPVVRPDGVEPRIHENDVRRREACRIAVVDADRVRTVGLDERVHPHGDVVDRLAPAGLDIGVTHTPNRIEDPSWMLDKLVRGPALGAEVLPRMRILFVRGDLGDPVVLNRHFHTTRGQAVPAEGVHRPATHAVILPEAFRLIRHSADQAWVMAQYSPRRASSWSWLPRSTILPASITRMTSASRIVESRCAMMKLVRSRRNSPMARWINSSVRVSTELVASSRTSSCGRASTARAMVISCFSPALMLPPPSLTIVW